jgi:hypothetical protein
MLNHPFRTAIVAAALTLVPAASASARTETLRFFSKVDKVTLTHADGTVETNPAVEPVPGDRLDVFASDFVGNHKRHAKKATGSEHVVCTFGTSPAPDCVSHVAIGGSMLIFSGAPATVIGGTGKYLGATGKVISNETIEGSNDSDVVVRVTVR